MRECGSVAFAHVGNHFRKHLGDHAGASTRPPARARAGRFACSCSLGPGRRHRIAERHCHRWRSHRPRDARRRHEPGLPTRRARIAGTHRDLIGSGAPHLGGRRLSSPHRRGDDLGRRPFASCPAAARYHATHRCRHGRGLLCVAFRHSCTIRITNWLFGDFKHGQRGSHRTVASGRLVERRLVGRERHSRVVPMNGCIARALSVALVRC